MKGQALSVVLPNGKEVTYCERGAEHKEVVITGAFYFHTFMPVVEELAGETEGVTFAKVNVDENGDVAMGLGIQAIPTLILFKDGQAVDQVVGVQSKQALKAMIDRNR